MTSPNSTPRFRFSLRWLLVFIAVIAIALGMLAFPLGLFIVNWLYVVLLRGVVPSVVLAAAFFGRGDVRAFALGALVACLSFITGSVGSIFGLGGLSLAVALPALNIAICGTVAVATRRWLIRQGLASDR